MSVNSVSALSNAYSLQSSGQTSPLKQIRQDFDALGQALGAGNLGAAQQAFSAYQQDLQGLQQANATQPGTQGTMQNALNAIGTALNAGDVSGAQKAYAALQQALQAGGGHGHHHHHAHAVQSTQAATTTPAADPSVGLNVLGINLTA